MKVSLQYTCEEVNEALHLISQVFIPQGEDCHSGLHYELTPGAKINIMLKWF